jgi:acetolactate decarboxylase
MHFLSEDRTRGGHLLNCEASRLDVQVQDIDDFRIALPESRQFLQADLTRDPSGALDKAEHAPTRR